MWIRIGEFVKDMNSYMWLCIEKFVFIDNTKLLMYYCQHRKVFQVEYGRAQSDLSGHLMKAILTQNIHKDLGMPITDECLHRSTNPTNLRLNLDLHKDSTEYPLFYKGTMNSDYQQAIFVLSDDNLVTMRELHLEFPQTDNSPQSSIRWVFISNQ